MDSLVLSGGGVKGYVYIGIIIQLFKKDLIRHIKNFSGTSIGAIFCLLLIINFTDKEIYNLFINFNIVKLKEFSYTNILTDELWGFNKINNLMETLKLCMKYKHIDPNITFHELNKKFNVNFYIVATSLVKFTEKCFSNKSTPNIKVLDAIRASINLPILFNKFSLNDEYLIDGGFTNNFPIEYLITKESDENNTKILGICIEDEKNNSSNDLKVNTILDYIYLLLKGIYINYGRFQRQKLEFYKNNENIKIYKIKLNSSKISTIKFDISIKDKLNMIKIGYNTIN